jgi:hypothetical protein
MHLHNVYDKLAIGNRTMLTLLCVKQMEAGKSPTRYEKRRGQRVLLPLISPASRVLVILLVTIIALYVVVVLFSFVGIRVPVPGFQ